MPAVPQIGNEFQQLRQLQETRNEILINYAQLVHFAFVMLANVATLLGPVAPYRASPSLLAFLLVPLVARVFLWAYLRRQPPYRPGRKYLISTFDLVIFTAGPVLLGMQGAYPWLFIGPFSTCIYAMLIVLSGLRYDARIVVYNGIVAMLLHAVIFPWMVAPTFQLPVLMVGMLTLGFITFCISYNTISLIRVYKDATTKEQLARFLPPELVEQMALEPDLMQRKTERREATVIFADIRGFTQISEQLTPERVVDFLNLFLDEMTQAIMEHQGMVDKYIGDAVMGVFGVPVSTEDHALRALETAIEMQERLARLNIELQSQGLPPLSIGIGLHTGQLLIGAIGSARRLDYTVVGDTVNVASRIEGMTRSYPVEILVSQSTRDAIGDRIPLYPIARVQVKNRVEPVMLWSTAPRVDASNQE